MYAIPAHRTTDARRATTDLRVVIAGPAGTAPESPVTRDCSGESVGRMNPMIGRGAQAHVRVSRRNTHARVPPGGTRALQRSSRRSALRRGRVFPVGRGGGLRLGLVGQG